MKTSPFPQLERAASDLEGARVEEAEVVHNDGKGHWELVVRLGHRGTDDGDVTLRVAAWAVTVE